MATHSIGQDKVMVSVPMDLDLSRELGRKAFALDMSKARLMRKLLRLYLAGKIALSCLIVAWGLGSLVSYSATGYKDDLVRPARSARRRREDLPC